MTEREAWELNTKIAEVLGFRFEEFADKLRIITPRPSEQWKQEAFGAVLVPRDSKYPYETPFDIGLRDWARDTDAALELVTGNHWTVTLWQDKGFWYADIPAHGDRKGGTPAEAICRAWLMTEV